MPNDDRNLEINIRTTADLTGAQAVETQLDRDIALARELENQREESPAPASQTPHPAENVEPPGDLPAVEPASASTNPPVPERAPEFPSPPQAFAESAAFNVPQSDNLPAAAEKLRVALDRNNQLTAALFERTLDLVEQQTRELTALDRRLAELAGQIKGLKNR